METQKKQRRRLIGTVVSDKMQKTVVVKVDRTEVHPIYAKRFTLSKKYKAHNSDNKAKMGDMVVIEETRPLSKEKCWRIIEIKH